MYETNLKLLLYFFYTNLSVDKVLNIKTHSGIKTLTSYSVFLLYASVHFYI